jgi:ATP-dependent exoDNAse (exonuclease V) beta subunit
MIDLSTPNLQILANAGSGKTHTLVTRIIRLAMMGVDSKRVVALTFTRKAAGEFLSKLLTRLAAASLDPVKAAELSQQIGWTEDCASYQRLLRKMIHDLGHLQLTTLDSFFNRIVAAFPQELGLSGMPTLLDPHAKEVAGKESLRRALNKLTDSDRDLLLQALFERDEESVSTSPIKELDEFRQEIHGAFLDHPEPEAWGNPERIWGIPQNPWQPLTPGEHHSVCLVIENETGSPEFPAKVQEAWKKLQELTRGVKPNALSEKVIADFDLWKTGEGSVDYNRKNYTISAESSRAAAALVENFLYESTEYRLREARAIHHLLTHYEEEYQTSVRERGRLSFEDVTRLLQPEGDFLGISSDAENEGEMLRLRLDERLDARFDHWLLDEFQDTSREQYLVLENILDEVISEAARGGERSFFCVGDIKQAIYGWRKGDARLFDEIYRRYCKGGGLKREALSISWRSSKEVLEILNALFGDLETTASTLPQEALDRWREAWTPHQRTSQAPTLPGYFSWRTYQNKDQEDVVEPVLSLLKKMQPKLAGGMTIALIVRTNDEANNWIETLRLAGIEALSESNPPMGRDNPVAAAFHSALSLSIHPGDLFALHHLSLSPLREIFFPRGQSEEEINLFIQRSAKLLSEGGFAAFAEWFVKTISPLLHDEFSKGRAEALCRAALKADTAGLTAVEDFLEFLAEYQEQRHSAPQAVQVMTIHKAKGLEYDMVVVPLSERQLALDALGQPKLETWHNEQGDPFLMKLPAEVIRSAKGNETLAHAAEQKRSELAFESLCVWYVALSRAKQALYVFSQEAKEIENGKAPNFPQLIAAGLEHAGGLINHSLGDPEWYEKIPSRYQSPPPSRFPSALSFIPRPAALEKQRPSDQGQLVLPGAQAFLPSQATILGSEIHALFESIDWLIETPWMAPASTSPEARTLIEPCLAHPEIQQLFRRPETPHTLWLEQRFDLVQSGKWISGCFDRVVIFRDENGRASRADLIDFKTDQGGREKLILNYRSQLESYREALSQILRLPEAKIRIILIHVRANDPVIVL